MNLCPSASFALSLMVSAGLAQVPATYSTFGTGCPGTGTGLGDNHVLPAAMASRFGGGNAIPFGWSPVRYQQPFAGGELPVAFTMAGLSLRQPSRGPVSHGFTVDLEIQVGFTTRTPTSLSTTFAVNFDDGPPVTVLPRTQLVIPDMAPVPPTDPSDFLLTVPWPTTFDWVPAPSRNFLVQVTVFGNSYGGSIAGYAFDAGGGTTGRLYGSPATATTGTLEPGLGIVMGIRALTHTAVPSLYSDSTPQIGDTFRVRLGQARPSTSALLLLGFSDQTWAGAPLPLGLGWLGAPGCALATSVDSVKTVSIDAAGAGSHSYALPNSIYLLGLRFYNQALIADPAANALGFALTNGGVGLIGNQ